MIKHFQHVRMKLCYTTGKRNYLPGFTFLVPAHPRSPGHSPGDHKRL